MLLESCLLRNESRIQIEMTYLDICLQCITEFAWFLIFSILIWVELKSIFLIYPNALSVVDTK